MIAVGAAARRWPASVGIPDGLLSDPAVSRLLDRCRRRPAFADSPSGRRRPTPGSRSAPGRRRAKSGRTVCPGPARGARGCGHATSRWRHRRLGGRRGLLRPQQSARHDAASVRCDTVQHPPRRWARVELPVFVRRHPGHCDDPAQRPLWRHPGGAGQPADACLTRSGGAGEPLGDRAFREHRLQRCPLHRYRTAARFAGRRTPAGVDRGTSAHRGSGCGLSSCDDSTDGRRGRRPTDRRGRSRHSWPMAGGCSHGRRSLRGAVDPGGRRPEGHL